MHKVNASFQLLKPWIAKGWVQWMLVTVFFFLLSWLYMGRAITDCSTSTVAFNSDSTGGFGWLQWVGGNDLTWENYTNKTNFPYGESLERPQYITSAAFIVLYKVLSIFSTPICGLNLAILLGYMSTGLLMFGLIRWLIRRFDIALFAGYAAAFVPYHHFKSQSHMVYVWGSIFIAMVWVYLWFLSKPSYKKAACLSAVGAIGFYFDGYFILISALVMSALYVSSFIIDFIHLFTKPKKAKSIIKSSLVRLRYVLFSVALLGLLLAPILYMQKTEGAHIQKSLSLSRSDPKLETITYGLRPIEFLLPSPANPLMPDGYASWRLEVKRQHYSNPSETTLYIGYVILVLALIALIAVFFKPCRSLKFRGISYQKLFFIVSLAVLVCSIFSLPAKVFLFGRDFITPTNYLVEVTPSWRVLARLFLAIHPLVVMLASLGLFILIKNMKSIVRITLLFILALILFLEYLPSPLSPTGDLIKNTPKTHHKIAEDKEVDTIAEYPIIDFNTSPSAFTFQQFHNKNLVNATDAKNIKGPVAGAIAGLNDPQTLGVLKKYGVDVITFHSKQRPVVQKLETYFNENPNVPLFSYRIKDFVRPIDYMLVADKGFDYLSVDTQQISHRALLETGIMKVKPTLPSTPMNKSNFMISFSAQPLCDISASLKIFQKDKVLWQGQLQKTLNTLKVNISQKEPISLKSSCTLDITRMQVE